MNLEPKSDPCSVCGETNSTGWHFGTITCEACKKFFIRNSESEHEQFKCVRSNNCVITKSTRTNCPQCRYQKCLQVGMNSNGKRTFPLVMAYACYLYTLRKQSVNWTLCLRNSPRNIKHSLIFCFTYKNS